MSASEKKNVDYHDVLIEALGRSRYCAKYFGEILVRRSREPIFDACRALNESGLRERRGPEFRRWAPSPFAQISGSARNVVSSAPVDSQTAISGEVSTTTPEKNDGYRRSTPRRPEAIQQTKSPACCVETQEFPT